jgi:hypothetical protein
MFDSWLTLSGSGMDLRQVGRDLSPGGAAAPGAWGHPLKFAVHRDAGGRFELGYPSGWELEAGEGVLVRSNCLSCFAKVDVLPEPETPWTAVEERVAKAGGSLKILKEIAGPPRGLRGLLEVGGARFDLYARAWTRGGETIVLSTGRCVDAGPGASFKNYEDQVLTAIRREFKLT